MTSVAERGKSRLRRTINLAAFLTNNSGVSARTVCAVFGISGRELVSLLNEILMCGVPPYGPSDYVSALVDGEGVSISNSDWLRRPLDLSASEALSLKMMIGSVIGQSHESFRNAAESLQAKIAGFLVHVPETAGEPAHVGGKSEIIRQAMREHRVLKILYYSRFDEIVSERMIEPLEFVDVGGIQCMAAYCRYSHVEKLFALARTRDITLTEEVFEKRDFTDARPFMMIERWARKGLSSYITVTFEGKRASWAREHFAGARFEELGDGGLRCVFQVEDPQWIIDIVAGFDAQAAVEGPEEYRRFFHERLSAVDDLYRAGRSDQ